MTDLMQYADVIKQKDQHDEGFQRSLIVVKGYLVDVENTGTPLVSARPGFVWVREYGANGGVFQAFLSPKVQARVELPVLIMYNPVKPFLRQVIDVDWSEMINYEDFDNQPLLGLHAQDHEWPDFTPGADPVNVYLRALVPLKTFPNVGLTVRMAPFVYEVDNEVREYFGETSIDISEHQPASGEAVYVLTYFDVEANAAASVAGAPVADSPAVTPNIPDVPENAYQSALVRLDGDQTTFAETDIKDVRKLYEISKTASIRGATLLDVATAVGEVDYVLSEHIVNHPSSGGTPGGSDTQLQYNNGGSFGGAADLLYDDVTGLFTVADSILVGAASLETAANIELWPAAAQDARIVLINNQAVSAANTVGLDGYLNNNTPALVKYGEISIGSTTTTPGSEYGVVKIDVLLNGTMRSVLYLDATGGLSFNNDQQDINMIFRSVNAPQLLVLDAGANEVRIGSTTPLEGGVAVFGSSGVFINPQEADRDFVISGNGVTNGYFYDAGNNRHGFGTGTPGAVVDVVGQIRTTSGSDYLSIQSTGGLGSFLSFVNSGNATLDFNPAPNDGSGNALFRLFRNTNTTGAVRLQLFKGDGTGTSIHIIDTKGTTIFNEQGDDIDFRVESDNDPNNFYSNAGTDNVGIGTASPNPSAKLEINSTTGALLLPRMTTTQQNALTGTNGMLIFNSTTNKFRGHVSGAWVDLH